MMRHIYITANRTLFFKERNVALACESSKRETRFGRSEGGTGWPGESRSVAFANLLSRSPLRGPRADFVADVELRTIKEVDMKGGTVVAAFPSVGLVSTITATYLITTLPTDQVTALESPDFPSISMIYGSKPKFPARVYASRKEKVAIFICEMPLPMSTHRPVAYALMKWAKDHGCRQIVPLEGLPAELEAPLSGEPTVWGVGSTDRARAELKKRGIQQLESGMISGVTGILLNEGRWRDVDVIALLAEARLALPDATAAVGIVKGLDNLLPEITIDFLPLQEQAKMLEEHLTKLKQQATSVVPPEPVPTDMYR